MKPTANTILVTGAGSGIGRGLAEALQARGNKVIIAGRRRSILDATIDANRGMEALQLGVLDPASIGSVAARVIREYPDSNVLANNAGTIQSDSSAGEIDDSGMISTITTNLMRPIRLTSALLQHLRTQDSPVTAHTTSVLGFVLVALTAVYLATKAALHSYVLSQRFLLRESGVQVDKIAPPWTRTDAEAVMPIADFVAEAMRQRGTTAGEIVLERARQMRTNVSPEERDFMAAFNARMLALYAT